MTPTDTDLADMAAKKLTEFAARDSDAIRREMIDSLRKDKPDITQAEIDAEIGLFEATIGF
jgi:hypothetical protein